MSEDDTRPVPQAGRKTREALVMSESTTQLHNSGASLLVIDTAGHMLGGGETAGVTIDTVTQALIESGALVVVASPEPEKKAQTKRAPRQRDAGDDKEGE